MSSKSDDDFIRGTTDNLPKVDFFMLLDFAVKSEKYLSAEIKNIKSERSMRGSYTDAAVGRVALRRKDSVCTVKAEVCPEHRQRSKNYDVLIVVHEHKETVEDLKCLTCAASQGGCKHALAFLMWICNESSKPSPTEVKSYWAKPKLSNISVSATLTTKDFGEVSCPDTDVGKFFTVATSSTAPLSSFQRYHSKIDDVSELDMHYLILKYVKSRKGKGAYSPEAFKEFCKVIMTEQLCAAALEATAGQANSRQWPILRYGRTSASNVHEASRSKKETGGVLKELILGGTKLKLTKAMKRGQDLEKKVLKVVKRTMNLTVQEVGIQLSGEYPEFGASPDGITDEYVIEIKCPYSEKSVKNFIVDGKVTKKYLAQIQLQIKLCKRSKGLFCVAAPDFEETSKVEILVVEYDPNFIGDVMAKAGAYWDKHIFPVLLSSASA